jgi:hypothetical protein
LFVTERVLIEAIALYNKNIKWTSDFF